MTIQGIARMKKPLTLLLAAAALATSACTEEDLTVVNPNSPTPQGALGNPTQAAQLLANGIMAAQRNTFDDYVLGMGNFGRESFNVFPTDGRTITGWYRDWNDPLSFSGGALWTQYYANLRNIGTLRTVVDGAATLSAGQKAGATGFAQTEEALALYYVLMTRNSLGIPVEVNPDPAIISPFVSRDSAYARIANTLDAGYAALTGGGAAFPFSIPGTQYAGFNTPTTYAHMNRAIAARVAVQRASLASGATRTALYNQALTALGTLPGTFIATTRTGPQHVYSTAAGDSQNGLFIVAGAQGYYANQPIIDYCNANTSDTRCAATIVSAPAATPVSSNVTTSFKVNLYPANNSPMQVITAVENLLNRAEARWFTGDPVGALADLNAVRAAAGLGTVTPVGDAAFITALLRERQVSLFGTGLRWVDVRRFGRIATDLPTSGATFTRNANLIVPDQECVARVRTGDAALACPTFVATDPQNGTL